MISVRDLSKGYGSQVVLEGVEFQMGKGERLGLVGRNGHGKSTLFKLLLGEESPDGGTIAIPKGYRLGHLSQHLVFEHATILDEVCAALGDTVDTERWRAEAALMGLGFTREDLGRPASEFSGGFQIRVNLARVLVEQPDLLLLDEPTNHLDIVALRWLARFLQRWPSELLLITHDRHFMDAVCTHTMAIHRRKLRRMPGSVDKLLGQIATEEEVHEATRVNEEKKRKQDERFIERFRAKASKASLVKSREKQLARRGRLEKLDREHDLRFRFRAEPFAADTVLRVDDLAFGYDGGPRLIDGLSFELGARDRLAIVGPNGRGKSTLLKLLADELVAQAGGVRPHPKAALGVFGQTAVDRLPAERSIEEELQSEDPSQSRSALRGLCGLLMFPGDAAEKTLGVLSGGEKSRVLLGKLLLRPTNLLLLDEPTHHLDMPSIEGLLDAVDEFPGAVVIVTHSEHILERVAERLIVFDGGQVRLFEGGYADFLERVGWSEEFDDGAAPASTGARPQGKERRKLRAQILAERNRALRALQRETSRAEDEIVRLEDAVAAADARMAELASGGDPEELARLAQQAVADRRTIEEEFAHLERLSQELEQAAAPFDARLAELGDD